MNNKGTTNYQDKVSEVLNKADMLDGCENRMCVTDDFDELFRLYAYLTLYAADLYRLNKQRLCIKEYGDLQSPKIVL